MVQRGSKGPEVAEVQKLLNQAGYKVAVDGVFGPATEAAVKQFQHDKQLKVDGIVGPVTMSLLKQAVLGRTKQAQIIRPVIIPSGIKIPDLRPLPAEQVKYIILHHSDSPDVPAKTIDQWHRSRGFDCIGYHLAVHQDGKIESGRPLNKMGAHALGINDESIGIVFLGNFEKEQPTQAQIEAGKKLVQWLKGEVFKKPLVILGHREVASIRPGATVTACPGKNFPLAEFKKL